MLSTSTEEEMLLGRLLVAKGLIDSQQLESALAGGDGKPRLGTALIRAGVLSAADLRGVLTDKVRRLLLDALGWTDGGFFFDDTPPAPRRPTISAIVGLTEVLNAATAGPQAAIENHGDDLDDVIVTDEDIIEIIELTQPRRPSKLAAPVQPSARKRRTTKRRPPPPPPRGGANPMRAAQTP
jgi:hypothetical protein